MSHPPLATSFGAAELPATMAMAARARALRAAGKPVISLSLGEPDFAPLPHILEAADRAAREGHTRYPPVAGQPALRAAIAQRLREAQGLAVTPDQVIVTNGARQAIFGALMASLDPGCEILLPSPYWNAYPLIARAAGCGTITLPCTAADAYLPDPDQLEARITARTRWVILNFPANPTGAVCDTARLRAIGAVLARHPHVWIMSDEIYKDLIHDGTPHSGIAAACPDLRARTLIIDGVSKSYAMTGFRIGWAAGPPALIEAITRAQGLATGGVNPMAQAAALAALTGDQSQLPLMRAAYARRAAMVCGALRALPGVVCPTPRGAFYAFADVSAWLGARSGQGRLLAEDSDIATALLEEALVAVVAGSAFGAPGALRLSTAAADDELQEACRRIAAFAAALQR